jgi:hypothetical protein
MQVKLVEQIDDRGCAIACMAMVLGKTYPEIIAGWKEPTGGDPDLGRKLKSETGSGLYYGDVVVNFAEVYGVPTLVKRLYFNGTKQEPWPPQPFAPVHLCAVRVGRELKDSRSHFIVMDNAGVLFDPIFGANMPWHRYLDSIPECVIGVWPTT